jgi:ethanolamine transporter
MSITALMSVCAIAAMAISLGDLLFGNRLGLGGELEKGILSAGRLILLMTGFMVLAPALSETLAPVIAPFFAVIGCDPSAFAGVFMANDCGGAILAMGLALDPQAGLYNGFIVGSMLGTTVMGLVAMAIAFTTKRERPAAIVGLVAGIITIPIGSLTGGLVAGFDRMMVLRNTVPCLALSLVLTVALMVFKSKMIAVFDVFGKCMLAIAYIGLVVASIQSLLGIQLLKDSGNLKEIFYIIANISLFLAGILPFLAILRWVFRKPLEKFGTALRMTETDMAGMVATLANSLLTMSLLREMTPRGIVLNMAFITSASFVFGDHLAFTSQLAPEVVPAMVAGKLAGGVAAVVCAMLLCKHVELER